jgi:hypothetical protein
MKSRLALLVSLSVAVAGTCLHAQAPASAPVADKASNPKAPASRSVFLNLPRLKLASNGPTRLTQDKVAAVKLRATGSGTSLTVRDGFKILEIAPGGEWSQHLRGKVDDITFASFMVWGSEESVLDIGGARLVVQPGRSGYADFVVPAALGRGAAPLVGFTVKLEQHRGMTLAAAPVFTVRLDESAGVWDLYVFDRLLAGNLPLKKDSPRSFSVQSGKSGAIVLGLVLSDENPLFLDANANGIDDTFEKSKKNGVLLAAKAPTAERAALLAEWKLSQPKVPPKTWPVRRPSPDR